MSNLADAKRDALLRIHAHRGDARNLDNINISALSDEDVHTWFDMILANERGIHAAVTKAIELEEERGEDEPGDSRRN